MQNMLAGFQNARLQSQFFAQLAVSSGHCSYCGATLVLETDTGEFVRGICTEISLFAICLCGKCLPISLSTITHIRMLDEPRRCSTSTCIACELRVKAGLN